jgi:hypothetical protein
VIPWLLGFAMLVAQPPSVEQIEDVDAWQTRARVLLDGPPACVELRGDVRYELALYVPGGWLGPGEQRRIAREGTFSGTLDHGLWRRLEARLDPVEGEDAFSIDQIRPMVGRLPSTGERGGSLSVGASNKGTSIDVAGGARQGLGLLDQIIEGIDPAVTLAWSSWDASSAAMLLHQSVPLGVSGSQELLIVTTFPAAGPPTALDAEFPKRFRIGTAPFRVTLMNAQLHLRGEITPLGVLPTQESSSVVLGFLGWTLGVEQRLHFRGARACAEASGSAGERVGE